MPSPGLQRLIEHALSDETFATRLQTDLDGAIAGYDLAPDEIEALRSRDPARMEAAGVDARISKLIIVVSVPFWEHSPAWTRGSARGISTSVHSDAPSQRRSWRCGN